MPFNIGPGELIIVLIIALIVVGTTYAALQDLADNLETDFRKRLSAGDQLRIDLDGNAWTYTVGQTILKCTSSNTPELQSRWPPAGARKNGLLWLSVDDC